MLLLSELGIPEGGGMCHSLLLGVGGTCFWLSSSSIPNNSSLFQGKEKYELPCGLVEDWEQNLVGWLAPLRQQQPARCLRPSVPKEIKMGPGLEEDIGKLVTCFSSSDKHSWRVEVSSYAQSL